MDIAPPTWLRFDDLVKNRNFVLEINQVIHALGESELMAPADAQDLEQNDGMLDTHRTTISGIVPNVTPFHMTFFSICGCSVSYYCAGLDPPAKGNGKILGHPTSAQS